MLRWIRPPMEDRIHIPVHQSKDIDIHVNSGPYYKDDRMRWKSNGSFFLTISGATIGLGNLLNFPFVMAGFGGWKYLLVYALCSLFLGIPSLIMEVTFGQILQSGHLRIMDFIHPRSIGFGLAIILMGILQLPGLGVVTSYYLVYLTYSFSSELPWLVTDQQRMTCQAILNPDECNSLDFCRFRLQRGCMEDIVKYGQTFFDTVVTGVGDKTPQDTISSVSWKLALAALFLYVVIFLVMRDGILFLGDLTLFTVLGPVIIMIFILINSLSLEGSTEGLVFLFTGTEQSLFNAELWTAAGSQTFYSLTLGYGIMSAFASYNPTAQPYQFMTICLTVFDFVMSFFSSIMVFAFMGNLALITGDPIEEIAAAENIQYILYPLALSSLPGGRAFAVMFFVSIFLLAFDSIFSIMEIPTVAMADSKSFSHVPRQWIIGTLCILGYILNILCSTDVGPYLLSSISIYTAEFFGIVSIYGQLILCGWIACSLEQRRRLGTWRVVSYAAIWLSAPICSVVAGRLWDPLFGGLPWAAGVMILTVVLSVLLMIPGEEMNVAGILNRAWWLVVGNVEMERRELAAFMPPGVNEYSILMPLAVKYVGPLTLEILLINFIYNPGFYQLGEPDERWHPLYQHIAGTSLLLLILITFIGSVFPSLFRGILPPVLMEYKQGKIPSSSEGVVASIRRVFTEFHPPPSRCDDDEMYRIGTYHDVRRRSKIKHSDINLRSMERP